MYEALFGAPVIALDRLWTIEKAAPDLIVWAAPVMFLLTGIEILIMHLQQKPYYNKQETIGSTLVGLGSVVIGTSLKLGLLCGVVWLYNLLFWRVSLQWWTAIPCYLIFDFLITRHTALRMNVDSGGQPTWCIIRANTTT